VIIDKTIIFLIFLIFNFYAHCFQ